MTRRYYANSAPQQTLQSSITSGAVTCTINGSFTGWPTQFPFFATLDLGGPTEEIVLVSSILGTTATIVRGQDGTSAVAHAAGCTIDQTVVRQDLDEAAAHVYGTAGVHGVSGSVVGTTDVQTLSGKTLTAPVINNGTQNSPAINTPTVTGGTHIGNPAIVGKALVFGAKVFSGRGTTSVEHSYIDDAGNAEFDGVVTTNGVISNAAIHVAAGGLTVLGSTVLAGTTVNGNETVNGNVNVNGAVSAVNVSTTSNISATGALITGGLTPQSFTDQAAATAGITGVAVGTLVNLTAPTGGPDAGIFFWTGSAWKRVAAKLIRGSGSATIHAGNSTETSAVTFTGSDTFLTAPIIVVCGTGNEDFLLAAQSPTTSGFTLRITSASGSAVGIDHSVPYAYFALGQQQ